MKTYSGDVKFGIELPTWCHTGVILQMYLQHSNVHSRLLVCGITKDYNMIIGIT